MFLSLTGAKSLGVPTSLDNNSADTKALVDVSCASIFLSSIALELTDKLSVLFSLASGSSRQESRPGEEVDFDIILPLDRLSILIAALGTD